ncbi:MAG TPA: hypothetical protein VLL52_00470 [Anaerolineae bacterium]|nr:hypothetical protein [Anaerolineae bacterium]
MFTNKSNFTHHHWPLIILLTLILLTACQQDTNNSGNPRAGTNPNQTTTNVTTPLPITPVTLPPTATPFPTFSPPTTIPLTTTMPLTTTTPWTIFVYIDGNNSHETAALTDFQEMITAGVGPDIHLVVQIVRHPDYDQRDGDWRTSRRYLIRPRPDGNSETALWSEQPVDMNDPATLTDFIRWGADLYPANHYGLIAWDATLNTDLLITALNDTASLWPQNKLDFIALDAPHTAQLTTFAQFAPYAHYLIGRPGWRYEAGWNYNWIGAGYQDPTNLTTPQLAQRWASTDAAVIRTADLPPLLTAVNLWTHTALTTADTPQARWLTTPTTPIGLQYPAYLVNEQLSSTPITAFYQLTSQRNADFPITMTDYWAPSLPAGYQTHAFNWEPWGYRLQAGQQASILLATEAGPTPTLRQIAGLYQAPNEPPVTAYLVAPVPATAPAEIWQQAGSEWLARQPMPGATFQPAGGQPLPRGEDDLGWQWQITPLPAGDYRWQGQLTTHLGLTTTLATTITVATRDWQANKALYWDTTHGFQFLYPAEWGNIQQTAAGCEGVDVLACAQPIADTTMHLTRYTDLSPRMQVADWRNSVLAQFGGVDLLFERAITLDGVPALWTAYGYDGPTGPRIGVFIATIVSGNGYLLDIDGPAEVESSITLWTDEIAQSWLFRGADIQRRPPQWQIQTVANITATIPTNWSYQAVNGWYRWGWSASPGGFAALRTQPSDDLAPLLGRLLRDAATGVTNFQADPATTARWGPADWTTVTFRYDGITHGQVAARPWKDNQWLLLWSESGSSPQPTDEQALDFMLSSLR